MTRSITNGPPVGTRAKPSPRGANAPGLAGSAVAVVALTVGLFALATGHAPAGWTAVVLAVVLGAASAVWLVRTHRRVREAELAWHAANSDEPAPPPAS